MANWDEGLQLHTVDCNQASLLDDVIFTINGDEFALPASQYIVDVSVVEVG